MLEVNMHSQRQSVTKAASHPLLHFYYTANNVSESSKREDNGGKAKSLALVYLCLTVMSVPSGKKEEEYTVKAQTTVIFFFFWPYPNVITREGNPLKLEIIQSGMNVCSFQLSQSFRSQD